MSNKYALAIHGGAGTILKSSMTSEKETAYTNVLNEALQAGEDILKSGGSALDAVEKAVCILEDSELFNAGRGSVFTHNHTHELDASIMEGRERKAGAVTGLKRIKNPIALCRAILNHSEHVFLMAEGAEEFASDQGISLVEQDYFSTKLRRDQLERIRESGTTQLDHADDELKKFGTVGAVALDENGDLAAATSTGGTTNKRYGRIGDTPVIGAGTYAENGVCAVSSTGHGEFYLRAVAAYDLAAMIKYGGLSLKEASRKLIHEIIPQMGGDGGLISVDAQGEICMPFNTEGMYRASVSKGQPGRVDIYR